jgi:hypothetical protein
MYKPGTLINPPLYLVHATTPCERCRADMPVVALLAPDVPSLKGEIIILSEIREMPHAVAQAVRRRFPSFQFTRTRVGGYRYYGNTCPACSALYDDFYLHCEPDAPFCPMTAEEAERLTLEPMPLDEPITVRANLGMGIGDLILYHARRSNGTRDFGQEG